MATNPTRFSEVIGRVSTLSNVHILPTLDYGADDELLYFVTARHPARTLKEALHNDGALPVRNALHIARDIAAASAHAHERGVRHGDLRPRHIRLTPELTSVAFFGVTDAGAGAQRPIGRRNVRLARLSESRVTVSRRATNG
jgi:eukaryotic-like serine/threonine-protein kinase